MTFIKVAHHCPGCDNYFVEKFEFPEKYYCEEDGEYWDKDDGRNCPTCHKFGSNTGQPLCPNCIQEVEAVDKSVDPDHEDVMDLDGNEIVPVKKQRARRISEKGRVLIENERKDRYEKMKLLFDRDIKKYKLYDVKSSFRDDAVIALRQLKAVDSPINIYASASIASLYQFDGKGLPFSVSFHILSEGYQTKYRNDGGFCHRIGSDKDFDNLDELVTYANQRIGEIQWLAQPQERGE